MAKKENLDLGKMQKTCFIVTVQMGHIDKKRNWEESSHEEQIWELKNHWDEMMKLPNLQIARGQIESCPSTGRLHINAGLKFKRVWRANTLMNKWGCWAEPALNEAAVMNYGKKSETRVAELPNVGTLKKKKTGPKSPKALAIDLLVQGFSPEEICMAYPDVYFTHHRAIVETFKCLQLVKKNNKVYNILDEEE